MVPAVFINTFFPISLKPDTAIWIFVIPMATDLKPLSDNGVGGQRQVYIMNKKNEHISNDLQQFKID